MKHPGASHIIRTLSALLALAALTGCQSAKDIELQGAAFHSGNSSQIRRLLAEGASPTTEERLSGQQPLHFAAACGDIEAAKLLLAAGAKVDAGKDGYEVHGITITWDGDSIHPTSFDQPIHVAAQKGRLEMVKFLLTSGADVNAPGGKFYPFGGRAIKNPGIRPLAQVAGDDNAGMVRLLIASGAKVHDSEIFAAAAGHSTEIARLILEAGANVNARNEFETPLGTAAANGDAAMVQFLLASGAQVNGKSDRTSTALHKNTSDNAAEIARILIAAGADVNAREENGFTPLHFMAMHKPKQACHEAARLLIAAGADINARAQQGHTPLIWAVFNKDLGMVKVLLETGADTRLRPQGFFGDGKVKSRVAPTPLELAEDFGEKEIAALIREHETKRASLKR